MFLGDQEFSHIGRPQRNGVSERVIWTVGEEQHRLLTINWTGVLRTDKFTVVSPTLVGCKSLGVLVLKGGFALE